MSIVDCDFHHALRSDDVLLEYLPQEWREYVKGPEPSHQIATSAAQVFYNPHGFDRRDAMGDDGSPGASSPERIVREHLDRYKISHLMLTHGAGLYSAAIPNPYFAAAVIRALNTWTAEEWLAADPRFRGGILLPLQTPELAVAELRHFADHPQMIQALLCANPVGLPFGHPIFDPIHATAAELGLPIAIHAFGDSPGGAATSALAGGRPSFYAEVHSGGLEGMMTTLMSFIFHGVFERHPGVRVALLESGMEWVPGFLARLDANYLGLRRETPWCKRLPSEYFREHVIVASQPLDIETPDHPYWEIFREADLFGNIAFSSDFPHWDADTAPTLAKRLPADVRDAIMGQNAIDFYALS